MRLGYAIAAHLNPDVLLVDEVLTVGDLAFRRKCIQHMQTYLKNGGSLVLVSHSIYLLQSICQRGLFINQGQILFDGPAVEAVERYFKVQQIGNHHPKGNGASPTDDDAHSAELSQQNGATNSIRDPNEWADLNEDYPIAIDKVEMTPVRGDEIRTGEDAHITVRYRSIKVIDDVFWGFMIWTKDQFVCITADATGFSNDTHQVIKGRGQFRCTLPQLPLIAGTYALKALIGDSQTRVRLARFGWENTPAFFTVRSAVSEVDNLLALNGTLVRMNVQWEEHP